MTKERAMGTRVLAGAAGLALALMTAACSGGTPYDVGSPASAEGALEVTLNTFITESLEIDEDSGGPGDANLFVGADPADGSPSFALPTGGPATFIDWDDLGWDLANHRLLDIDDPVTRRDLTAFPLSNECVGSANVLSKMDLTYVASANNQAFAYLAVQRSANTGDAGYYWLFTREPPRLIENEAPCKRGMERLLYDITGPDPISGRGGDVLVKGHFKPSAEPLIEVFTASADAVGVTAVDAINYLSGLWVHTPGGVAAAAVNTTPTSPDSFGAEGVKSMDGEDLGDELFAEAAVPLWVFTGHSGNVCDATFYGSVITRSSGSGGTTPDLKDLAGPALFNFGTATAQAQLVPSCDQEFGYELLEAIGADGQPIASPVCDWLFNGSLTLEDSCNGIVTGVPAGAYTGELTVTDPISGCEAVVTTNTVDVYEPLGADAFLEATCAMTYTFDGFASGGSGDYGFAWTFDGGSVPASSSAESGVVTVPTPGVLYTGDPTVTDLRTDLPGICLASASDTAVPWAPLAVYLTPSHTGRSCPGMTADDVTFTAIPSGGDGIYGYSWNGVACTGVDCTIDPADGEFCPSGSLSVTVTDGSGICGDATSETETWRKETFVHVSNN
jgi:hypothetical protein